MCNCNNLHLHAMLCYFLQHKWLVASPAPSFTSNSGNFGMVVGPYQ